MAGANSRTQLILSSAALFCLALVLTAYSARNPHLSSVGASVADEIQAPVKNVFVSSSAWITAQWRAWSELVTLRKDYEELERRAHSLEADRSAMLEIEQENIRLRKLLAAGERMQNKILTARVTGFNPSSWVQSLTINRGSDDGVAVNLAVMSHDGIVGKVISVSAHTARVLLLTDLTSGIDAFIQSSRARGIVEGAGLRALDFKFALASDEISVGDRIVSSGVDGIFPPGLFIGRVSAIEKDSRGLFQEVSAVPAVETSNLEEVLVILKEKR